MRSGLYGAGLSFITKLGQDSNMLSGGVVLLVDGELAAGLQLFLGMNNANVVDDGNFLLGIPQDKGPHPVKAMAYTTSTGNVQISQGHTCSRTAELLPVAEGFHVLSLLNIPASNMHTGGALTAVKSSHDMQQGCTT